MEQSLIIKMSEFNETFQIYTGKSRLVYVHTSSSKR